MQSFYEDDNLLFITKVNGHEIIFGGTGNGLEAIDPPNINENLLAEIASEIDSFMM